MSNVKISKFDESVHRGDDRQAEVTYQGVSCGDLVATYIEAWDGTFKTYQYDAEVWNPVTCELIRRKTFLVGPLLRGGGFEKPQSALAAAKRWLREVVPAVVSVAQ